MSIKAALRRPRTWLLAVPIVVFLVAVVAPYVYIHFIKADPEPPLVLSDVTTTAPADGGTATTRVAGAIDGTWVVNPDSVAGYRVDEVLFGQDTEATGRTSEIEGELQIAGLTIDSASFTVDMSTIQSDEARRDNQFRNRIMDTSTFPTATFELTEPIALDALPGDGEPVTASATGELTLRGVTNSVTFDLNAQRNGAVIELNGTIAIEFADYEIPDASGGPATVVDHGSIEFLLVLSPA